jgi:hypothetical protein
MKAMSFMNAERRRERMRGNASNAKAKPIAAKQKPMVSRSTPARSVRGEMQPKAAKTAVLRRYIFYEMQADQAVKAIQFVNCVSWLLSYRFAILAV